MVCNFMGNSDLRLRRACNGDSDFCGPVRACTVGLSVQCASAQLLVELRFPAPV